MVPTPTSEPLVAPASDVKSSGADEPAAMNVAPATSSDRSSFSEIEFEIKNLWLNEIRSGWQCGKAMRMILDKRYGLFKLNLLNYPKCLEDYPVLIRSSNRRQFDLNPIEPMTELERVVRMVVDSILPHAECGPNDHRRDAPPFRMDTLKMKI